MVFRNLLMSFARQPWLLVALAVLAAVMLAIAVKRGRSNRKQALIPSLIGVAAIGLVAIVLITNPQILAGDTEAFEKIGGQTIALAPPNGDDWPQWRGIHRDGIGKAPGMLTDWNKTAPKQLWTAPCGGGFGSLAVSAGNVYLQDFVNGQERIVCLDAKTGHETWNYAYPVSYDGFKRGYATGPRATPTIHDRRIYTLGATGRFLCLEAANDKPKVIWEHDLTSEFDAELPAWGFASSPLIEGDLVIVQAGGRKGTVVAFNRDSGERVWTALEEPTGYSSPMAATLAGVRQIVAFTGSRLVGLNAADGSALWAFNWPTEFDANIATPIIAGDFIFISSGYNAGCALLKISKIGEQFQVEEVFVKRNKLMRTHHMTCVLSDGHVYGFDDGREELTCLDLNTATAKWKSNKIAKGCLILAEGNLIVLGKDGTLALVEATPAEFRLKGQLKHVLDGDQCWALPALANGRLYLRDAEKVVCLQLTATNNQPLQ